MKESFLLSPDVTFLNHGSFGACPRPVFASGKTRCQKEIHPSPALGSVLWASGGGGNGQKGLGRLGDAGRLLPLEANLQGTGRTKSPAHRAGRGLGLVFFTIWSLAVNYTHGGPPADEGTFHPYRSPALFNLPSSAGGPPWV